MRGYELTNKKHISSRSEQKFMKEQWGKNRTREEIRKQIGCEFVFVMCESASCSFKIKVVSDPVPDPQAQSATVY